MFFLDLIDLNFYDNNFSAGEINMSSSSQVSMETHTQKTHTQNMNIHILNIQNIPSEYWKSSVDKGLSVPTLHKVADLGRAWPMVENRADL